MRIAIVVSTFPPYKGGMGNVAFFHARELGRLGEDVTVFCPRTKGRKIKDSHFKIKYLRPVFKYGNAAWVPELLWELKGFDVVHLHYPFFGGAEAVYFWAKKNKSRKFVMTYHMDTVGSGWLNKFFKIYKFIFLRRMVEAAKRVFVSTLDYAQTGDLAKFLSQDPEKFIVSNLGVDTERFLPAQRPAALEQKFNLVADDFILLFVGGLDRAHYFKGLDYLLRSLNSLAEKKIKLVIVGEGDLRLQFENMVREMNLAGRVHFAGGVPNDELPDYYHLCDVFAFPSIDKSEAYGLVALEAGACAKPVIASSLPGVRHVVLDGKTGFLIEPKNEVMLARKITYLFNNRDEAERLGRQARERIEAEFTWEGIVSKLRELYRSV